LQLLPQRGALEFTAVKTLTIAMPCGDMRDDEVLRFLRENFPGVAEVEFREDFDFASPRAVELTDPSKEMELLDIDVVLFRHFNPCEYSAV
jgi:hypothetical protein